MLNTYCTNDPMFAQNGRVIHPAGAGDCWIIDPGLPPQASEIISHVRENTLVPTAILLTHAHADHFAGLDELRAAFPEAAVHLGAEEHHFLTDAQANLSAACGLPHTVSGEGVNDLAVGLSLLLGDTEWRALDTSGHSPGGRSIYCAAEQIVIVGDALFAGGIGRTDFPHSDHERLMRNLVDNLLSLPDETRVLSGHGPDTTIGRERKTNPFLMGMG
ncbi:MAG: MBL fold metallo-hydrolase [bacterium]|nr:MBL fold metallo-hydrolase [bacterium]